MDVLSFSEDLTDLARDLVRALVARDLKLVTAESCTTGLLSACVGQVPDCSQALSGGFVTYSPAMKSASLGVPPEMIAELTVYHADIARSMATGALAAAPEAGLAIAVSGVAGPEPDQGKPPGWVCIATALRNRVPEAKEHQFEGSPSEIMDATLRAALEAGRTALRW